MRIGARALYGYAARSDKELTFNRGDALQVITKTPDNNWWDGFHSGRRGFIPVAYVEITELKTSPSPLPPATDVAAVLPSSPMTVAPPTVLAVPAPPQRKSSIPVTEMEPGSSKPNEIPHQPSIEEEAGEEGEGTVSTEQTVGAAELTSDENAVVAVDDPGSPPPLTVTKDDESTGDVKSPTEVTSPKANFPVKSVRSLTMQFQDPDPVQQQQQQQSRVLVEPHSHTHRRHGSDNYKVTTSSSETKEVRSPSAGSKVSMLSSTFENKVVPAGPPPPIRPKPPPSAAHSAPASTTEVGGGAFPLMPHGTVGLTGVSPLQRVAHHSQHVQKPALGKKPGSQAITKPPAKGKAGGKLKKKDSLKDKSGKPAPNPKPTAGFVATPAEIQAELQARALKRK